MTPVPVLMILYSSDATEVRYSDGSRLELSPCGSTMIYHPSVTATEHPHHVKYKTIQKRTMFVTSEHRAKVLQALDFRNRFAERPYLCKELIPADDVLALYSKIDRIAWPRDLAKVDVEILPDGSRRITSLDEYASLIVSPHGQDFTVCYLSQISRERKSTKNVFAQSSKSASSFCGMSKISFEKLKNEPSQKDLRPKEAIVHPFESCQSFSYDNELVNNNNSNILSTQTESTSVKMGAKSSFEHGCKPDNFMPVTSSESSTSRSSPPHTNNTVLLNSINSIENVTFDVATNQKDNQNIHDFYSKTGLVQSRDIFMDTHFNMNSPSAQELSSISRSSTPDGLRMTIDSDATLIQDNTLISNTASGNMKAAQPSQFTSSPNDDVIQYKKKIIDSGSLNGSFLENCPSLQHDGSASHENRNKVKVSPEIGTESFSATLQNDAHASAALENISNHVNQVNIASDEDHIKIAQKLDFGDDVEGQSSSYARVCDCEANEINDDYLKGLKTNNQSHNRLKITEPDHDGLRTTKTDHEGLRTNEPEHDVLKMNEPDYHGLRTIQLDHNELRTTELDHNDLRTTELDHENRRQYVWLTKHISRNDCPTEWTIPLKLALGGHPKLSEVSATSVPSKRRLLTVSTHFKPSANECSFTTVPSPLPLLCPYQHKHKVLFASFQADQSEDQHTSGDFQHGKLKMIISEGVVYRLIQKGELKIIEIHPGDGSVLVSQGIQAHFYTHYILDGDKIEERTYSLKSLPPGRPKGRYSVEHLIKTANRFFLLNTQWEKRGLSEVTPCWNKDVIAVVEPLSTSLLEEYHVEGLGKFSAFSNGRVRIVFTDRTALDMVCNVSNRLNLSQGQLPQTSLPGAEVVSHINTVCNNSNARLLLPSGNYVTVDINCPGVYKRYIKAAIDWVSWVNTIPAERPDFYKHQQSVELIQKAAELELKKISCFNYIVDNTLNVGKHVPSEPSQLLHQRLHDSTHHTTSASLNPNQDDQIPSIQPQSMMPRINAPKNLPLDCTIGQTSVPYVSSQTSRSTLPRGDPQYKKRVHLTSSYRRNEDEEFPDVQQVLLQNSHMISEIDSFLEKTKKS
ncbi:uncharacterized protein LOC106057163 isoform X2 [Biomphalaria glabrata]|nr:uncharacterized protein LOC106057163 isoform X2 [Biomphalaria glabrata]XP_055868958.1 uncharacterized protein LOC106057163 isoform X2 [Biomphalaria glabrata]XP_055868959.1 uncharacterized protein LOC106057163 isoform X2 [Biomphalaria glabrata]